MRLVSTSDITAESLERGIAATMHVATFLSGAMEIAGSTDLIISKLRPSLLPANESNHPDRRRI